MRDTHIFACNQTDCSDKMYIHRVTTYPVPEYVDVPLADVEARCVGLQLLGEDRNLIFFQVEVFGGTFMFASCFCVVIIYTFSLNDN